jgi:putative oxidoreductase
MVAPVTTWATNVHEPGGFVHMDIGRTVLRGVVGPLFVGHGTQKLFGWFGGHGREGTAQFFEGSLGLRPGRRHATAAGAAEAVGGALLTAGFLTPVAATLISSTMVTAIRKVHAQNGPWVTESGYEYNLTLVAAMAMITETGPGAPSVDAARWPNLKGKGLAAAVLAAAVAGSYLATEVANEDAPPETAAPGPSESVTEVTADPATRGAISEPSAN